MAIIGAIPTWQLVDGDGPSHSTESSDAEDEDGDSATFVNSADENEEDAEDAPLLGGRREGYGASN